MPATATPELLSVDTNSVSIFLGTENYGEMVPKDHTVLRTENFAVTFESVGGLLTVWIAPPVVGALAGEGGRLEFDFLTVEGPNPLFGGTTIAVNPAGRKNFIFLGEVERRCGSFNESGETVSGIRVLGDSGSVQIEKIGAQFGEFSAELHGITLTLCPPKEELEDITSSFRAKGFSGSTSILHDLKLLVPHPTDPNFWVEVHISELRANYLAS